MSEHLTKEQIDLYANRRQGAARLAPADLLTVDEHLASCEECRGKALAASGSDSGSEAPIRAVFSAVDPVDDDHPEHELLAGYVDNTLGDIDKEIVEGHLEFCRDCAAEVAELRSFRAMLSKSSDKEYAPDPAAGMFQRMETSTATPTALRPAFRFAPAFAMAAAVVVAAILIGHSGPPAKLQRVASALGPETPTTVLPAPAPHPETPPSNPPASSEPKPVPQSPWNGGEGNIGSAKTPSVEAGSPSVSAPEERSASTFKPSASQPPSPPTSPKTQSLNTATEDEATPNAAASVTVPESTPSPQPSGRVNAPVAAPPPAPAAVLHPNDMMAMERPAAKTTPLPDAVKKVLASGHLDLNTPDITELTTPDIQDNIAASPAGFNVTSPVSTTVLTDRPTFTWEQAKDAASYQVTVTDDSGAAVATSPTVSSTSWKADKPLPTGQLLRWQVAATQSDQSVETAPTGGARFRVLDPDRAAQIEDAEKTFSDQPLALGILYAQAGMLDEAERAFQKAQKDDPTNAVVPKLLADVKAVRENSAAL